MIGTTGLQLTLSAGVSDAVGSSALRPDSLNDDAHSSRIQAAAIHDHHVLSDRMRGESPHPPHILQQ